MANLQGRKVRANSGVFALGFSDKMKSVAAAAAVLALATTGTVVVQAQTAPSAFAQEEGDQGPGPEETQAEDKIIDADAIASGRVTHATNLTDGAGVGRGLISGHVFEANATGNPGATLNNGNKALNGVTVYAQFRDKDGSYSPIFKAETHDLPGRVGGNGGPGTYAFGVGDEGIKWTDASGKEHVYSARTDQYHRVWVEPFTNENGNQMQMFRQANGFVPGSFNPPSRYPLGSFVSADLNMQLTAVFLQEVAPNHETSYMAAKGDKLIHDPEGPISNAAGQLGTSNVLSGRVWLETGGPDGGIVATGPSMNNDFNRGPDHPAVGYNVYASTLTPEGATANDELKAQYRDDPEQLAIATKRMLEDHPEYILKTVYGETDSDGHYALRFGDYTDRGQKREDFLNPNHVFVWVENKDGVVQQGYTGFLRPIFQRFNAGGGFRPAAIPGENQTVTSRVQDLNTPRYGKNVNSLYNVNFAVMPYAPAFITTDYNTTDNPAEPGDTVTPSFEGQLSSLPSKLEWRDEDGKVLKTCELDQSQGIKAQVSACTFDIPKDAKDGDLYTAVLVSGWHEKTGPLDPVESFTNDVSASSVLVYKLEDKDLYEPEYENGKGAPGETAEIEAPTFTDNFKEDVDAPEGTKFEKGEDAPEGTEVDEDTGAITYPIPEGAEPGHEIKIPVKVTYPDETSETVEVTVVVTDPDATDADKYTPEYKSEQGVPGSTVEFDAPEFKDEAKNTTEVEVPEGKEPPTFELGDDAPEGADVDRETGKVTVEIPENAEVGDTIKVPVVVTYPDDTTNETTAEVTVKDPAYSPFYPDAEPLTAGDTKSVDVTYPGAEPGEGVATYKLQEDYEIPDGWTVDVNAETGEVTVTAPEKDAEEALKDGNFNVPVTVEFSNGAESREATASFPFELQKDAFDPAYEHKTVQKGKEATVDAPKDRGGKDLPEGTTFAKGEGDNVPGWATVNENDGSIKLTPGDDVDTTDPYEIPVVVTYPDGSSETVNATVTVVDELPQAEQYKPSYDKTQVPVGKPATTNNPFKEENVPVEDVVVEPVDDWTIEPKGDSGVLEANGPTQKQLIKLYDEFLDAREDKDSNPTWAEFVEAFAPIVNPTTGVEFTYEDGSTNSADAEFEILGKDGKPATDPNGDFDDNGTTNQEEVENGKNPFGDSDLEEGDMNITKTPTWENATTKPGVPVDVENDGDPIPEGSTVEAESDKGWTVETDDETGTVTVTPPEEGKQGDKTEITVTVTYPDGSKDEETFTVTVEEDPKWSTDEDFKTTPDEPITLPNNGGPVKEGTEEPEVTGPGTAEFDENENLIITPTDDAEVGDEIEVVVKDPETGEEIDRIVVEIVEDPEDVTQTTPNEKPQGTQADAITPNWENQTVAPDSFVDAPNTKDELPEGTTLEWETSEDGWKVEIAEGTDDTLRVTPPKNAKRGEKTTVIVTVNYPDGSTDVEKFTVTVVDSKVEEEETQKPGNNGGSTTPTKPVTPVDPNKPGTPGSGNNGVPAKPGTPGATSDNEAGAGSGVTDLIDSNGDDAQSGAGDQSGAGADSASADRGGSLAMTGVSGVAIMLGAAAMAMAVGGALLALRRRRN